MTVHTTLAATCRECDWTGTTDRAAEKHQKDSGHFVVTVSVPDEGDER